METIVTNLTNPRTWAKLANQFEIKVWNQIKFQSYQSLICSIDYDTKTIYIWLDWQYSNTTTKYFKQFLFWQGISDLHDLLKKSNWKNFKYNNFNIIFA